MIKRRDPLISTIIDDAYLGRGILSAETNVVICSAFFSSIKMCYLL